MRHAGSLLVLLLTLLLVAAGPALAGDWVEGDQYRFRAPDGFAELAGGADARKDLSLKTPFGALKDAQAHVFVRQDPSAPAFVVTMSVRANGALLESMGGTLSLDALEKQAGEQVPAMDGVVEYRAPHRTFIGGGQQALEFSVTYLNPILGQRTLRCAVTVRDDQLVTLMMDSAGGNDEDQEAWQSFVASFRAVPKGLLQLALDHAPYVGGGLVLLLLLVWLGLRSRRDPVVWSTPRAEPRAAPAASGGPAGLSRAVDGLPLYREDEAQGAPLPAPATGPRAPLSVPLRSSAPEAPRPPSVPLPAAERPQPAAHVPWAPPAGATSPPPARDRSLPTNVALRTGGEGEVARPRRGPDPSHADEASQEEPADGAPRKLRIQRNSDFVG